MAIQQEPTMSCIRDIHWKGSHRDDGAERPSTRFREMRREGKRFALTALALISFAGVPSAAEAREGCGLFTDESKMIVFLLDTSLTIRHLTAFENAWNTIVSRAQDGDTIVLAVVKDGTGGTENGEFPYLQEQTFPCKGLTAPSKYRAAREQVLASLNGAFSRAVAAGRGRKTLLFSSLRSIAKYYADYGGRRILVLASDGLEDSEIARFETMTLSQPRGRTLIEDQLTPDMRTQMAAVSVWFVAAETPSEEKTLEIQRFWLSYFRAFGAELPSHRYAGTLLHYER
jgi:hypothetical protein